MKCIAHIDLDCFYAQVEALRIGVDCRTEPYVLSQWGNLIAVNYPARAAGISRFETLREAITKCPEVKHSHVATYAIGDPVYRYHENPSKANHKVSLDPYRNASRRIFEVFNSFNGVTVEKGGVDEAFLDISELARTEMVQYASLSLEEFERQVCTFSKVYPDRTEEMLEFLKRLNIAEVEDLAPESSEENLRFLFAGAFVVQRIREKVRTVLNFDCSAGVAHNKMLAKCISAVFKPNQQTILLPSRTLGYLFDFKFTKLRPFGGKLGQAISEASEGSVTCGELWRFPLRQFQERFSTTQDPSQGEYLYKRVHGFCDHPVAPRSVSKTLLAEKVFSPHTADINILRMWFSVLSQELMDRLEDFGKTFGVTGHTVNVKLGKSGLADGSDVGNKTFPLPTPTTHEALLRTAVTFATHILQANPTKVNSVSMTIGDFRKAEKGHDALDSKQTTLDRFFQSRNRASAKRERASDSDTDSVLASSQPLTSTSLKGGTNGGVVRHVRDIPTLKPREVVVISDSD